MSRLSSSLTTAGKTRQHCMFLKPRTTQFAQQQGASDEAMRARPCDHTLFQREREPIGYLQREFRSPAKFSESFSAEAKARMFKKHALLSYLVFDSRRSVMKTMLISLLLVLFCQSTTSATALSCHDLLGKSRNEVFTTLGPPDNWDVRPEHFWLYSYPRAAEIPGTLLTVYFDKDRVQWARLVDTWNGREICNAPNSRSAPRR